MKKKLLIGFLLMASAASARAATFGLLSETYSGVQLDVDSKLFVFSGGGGIVVPPTNKVRQDGHKDNSIGTVPTL